MSRYDKVRDFYEHGLWNISRVRDAVEKNWITPEEFYEITGTAFFMDERKISGKE